MLSLFEISCYVVSTSFRFLISFISFILLLLKVRAISDLSGCTGTMVEHLETSRFAISPESN